MKATHAEEKPRKGENAKERRGPAFSLVEVTIALGIVVFALVALFGLLAGGMRVAKNAKGDLMAAQAASTILAERRAAPAADLTNNPIQPIASLTNSTGLITETLSRSGRKTTTDPYYILRYEAEPVSPRLVRIFLALSHPAQGGANFADLAKAEQTYETTSYIRIK